MFFFFLTFFFIIISKLSIIESKSPGIPFPNMTCINFPLASLSSRPDDRFVQLKLFASPQPFANYSACGKFDIRTTHTVYVKSVRSVVESLCSILQAHPMLLIYLNDHIDENHATPAAYFFFLKLFTYLRYPMLTFHYFHPFHPQNFPSLRFFQLAPTYREEARALISLMERYDWNAFSLIIDPRLPGEEELISEFEEHGNEQRNCKNSTCNRFHSKGQKKLTILSVIHMKSINPIQIKYQLSIMNPETRVIIVHTTSSLASIIIKQASNMSLTGAEYMWIMSSVVLSTYSSGNERKMNPYDNPNRRKMDFFTGTLALYNDVTRDAVLTRFDRYIGPILIQVFSQIIHLNVIKEWNMNLTITRRFLARDQYVCNRLFANNTSFDDSTLQHSFFDLYHLLRESFRKANGVFQPDGLAIAGNYSVLNFQGPMKEWKKVGEYVNSTLSIADIQWPGEKSKPPPGKPVIYYLRVVTLEEHPFVMLKDPAADGKCQTGSVICRIGPENAGANHSDPQQYQCCSGFYIDIFNSLKDRLKFEFELYQVVDRTWGSRNPVTNKWNGLIAELLENRADLTLTSLKVTTERNAAIDFSVPLMETGIALIVSLRPGAISTTAFLKPYDYRIWILILLVTLHGVAVMVFLFEYFQRTLTTLSIHQKSVDDQPISTSSWQILTDLLRFRKRPEMTVTFFQSVWLTWVILFRAPAKVNNPRSFTSKFMTNVWACFCLAFTASYTANLAAFMITKDVYFELSGINDPRLANPLSTKPPFRFGTIANGKLNDRHLSRTEIPNRNFYPNSFGFGACRISTDEVVKTNHKKIYAYMKQFMKSNVSEGIRSLKAGELHAFLYDAVVLDYLSGQDDGCKLRVVGNWYAMTGYGLGFPKQSKFKEMINKEIIEMHHSGEIERLRRFWFTGACKSSVDQQSQRSSQKLDTLNFTSAFLLLFGGTLIATIILLCENAYSSFLKRTKRSTKRRKHRRNCIDYTSIVNQRGLRPLVTPRELFLERHVEKLRDRIQQLEKTLTSNHHDSSVLVLPVCYTPEREQSPILEITSYSRRAAEQETPLIIVEQSNSKVYETIV